MSKLDKEIDFIQSICDCIKFTKPCYHEKSFGEYKQFYITITDTAYIIPENLLKRLKKIKENNEKARLRRRRKNG